MAPTPYPSQHDPKTGLATETERGPVLAGCCKCGYDVTVVHNGKRLCGQHLDEAICEEKFEKMKERAEKRKAVYKIKQTAKAAAKRDQRLHQLDYLPAAEIVEVGRRGKPMYHVFVDGKESCVDYQFYEWAGVKRVLFACLSRPPYIVARVMVGEQWRRVVLKRVDKGD